MTLRVVPHSFASLQGEWEQLLLTSATDTIFLTPSWQRLWWEAFGEKDILNLLAFHRDEQLVGIAPMMRHGGLLSFLGETDLFDYHDFIVSRGHEEAFYSDLTEHLSTQEWEEVRLLSLPQDSPTLVYLPTLVRQRGWSCQVEQEDVAPGLTLSGDWDSYLLGLSKKDRHELRRKMRRFQGAVESSLSVCATSDAIQVGIEDFLHLMANGREDKRDFLTPQRQEFMRSVARELAAQGILRLYFLNVEGQRVATALCFDYREHRLLYNSGFDPQHANLSVGLVINALILESAIQDGIGYFDFLRGNERYKYDLGGTDQTIYRMVIRR